MPNKYDHLAGKNASELASEYKAIGKNCMANCPKIVYNEGFNEGLKLGRFEGKTTGIAEGIELGRDYGIKETDKKWIKRITITGGIIYGSYKLYKIPIVHKTVRPKIVTVKKAFRKTVSRINRYFGMGVENNNESK